MSDQRQISYLNVEMGEEATMLRLSAVVDPVDPVLGRATWVYQRPGKGPDVTDGMHIPCCSVQLLKRYTYAPGLWASRHVPCLNGPLTGDEVITGDCGGHG